MIRFFLLLYVVTAAEASAQSPDPKKVTDTSEAVRQCGIDKAAKRWEALPDGSLKIHMTADDIAPGGSLEGPLKVCFFPWAYERDVGVEIILPNAESK